MKWISLKEQLPPDNSYVLVSMDTTLVALTYTGNARSNFMCNDTDCGDLRMHGDISVVEVCPAKIKFWAKLSSIPMPPCAQCDKSCLMCHQKHAQ